MMELGKGLLSLHVLPKADLEVSQLPTIPRDMCQHLLSGTAWLNQTALATYHALESATLQSRHLLSCSTERTRPADLKKLEIRKRLSLKVSPVVEMAGQLSHTRTKLKSYTPK